jgi:hypothetical protein
MTLDLSKIAGSVMVYEQLALLLTNAAEANHPLPYTVRKGYRFPVPSRESLVSDIPAGDGKTANLFYSV